MSKSQVQRPDWKAIEQAASAQIVAAVRAVRDRHPDEHIYGAMFHEFYGDGSVIYWPKVTIGTEESLAEVAAEYAAKYGWGADSAKSIRWSGPDLILARVAELPREIVARGIGDPYGSFRDRGAHRPLDYGPLEKLLRDHPEFEAEMAEELQPGSGFCALDPEEIPTALAALESPWPVIRTHARIVLENAGVRGVSGKFCE